MGLSPIGRAIKKEKEMIDWTNLDQVKAYADKLASIGGMGQTVFKVGNCSLYNITHTINESKRLTPSCVVVYRTSTTTKEDDM